MTIPDYEHKPFPKIPRPDKIEVIITEKLDGTNALVYIDEELRVHPGSRNRWLTVDHDNHGFAKFCQDNSEMLARLGKGYHYGEFIGSGVGRRSYGYTNGEKKLYLFDTRLEGRELGDNIKVVPKFYHEKFDSDKLNLKGLMTPSSSVVPSSLDPHTRMEGIMIFLGDPIYKYIKVVYDKHK